MQITNNISFGALPQGVRVINKKLLASGRLSWGELRSLKDENVGQIIDLRTSGTFFHQIKEILACHVFGIKRTHLPILLYKNFPDKDTFVWVKKLIDKCPNRTLIHCNSGLHRTNLFCEAVQLLGREKSIEEAESSLIKNGFFKLRNVHKRSADIIAIQMNTLHKCLDDFKKMFS